MKKIISLFVLLGAISSSFGDGTFYSTTKITGAYIPIKAEASGTWQSTDDRTFNLLGSRKISGGFGIVKANMTVKSQFDKGSQTGKFEVLDCQSTGWVDVCDNIALHQALEYNRVDMFPGDPAKYEINTVFDDGDQVTSEHTFLIEE